MLGSRFFNFVIWTLVFAAALAALYWVFKRKSPENALARMNASVGPQLVTLFWYYGVLFDTPGNFSAIKRRGFIGFWFKPHKLYHFTDHSDVFAWMVAFGLGFLVFGLLVARKYAARATGTRAPALALSLWYLAGHAIWNFPNRTLSLFIHNSSLEVADLFDDNPYLAVGRAFKGEALFPLGVGLLLMTAAFFATRTSAKSRLSP